MSEMTMAAVADVIGDMGLVFKCATCGHLLDIDEADATRLTHPTHDEGAIFGKGKEINCPFAGKSFRHPFVMELKPL
jgi:hypothetical protein